MQKFLARQPIFNVQRIVFGYELLFRSSLENFFSHTQQEVASAATADNFFLFGVDHLTQGTRAFVNCTRGFLLREYPLLLPKDRVVIEILENIRPDDELVAACARLKKAGYLIALDDFRDLPEWRPLVALADFIKVDVLASSSQEQYRLAREFAGTNTQLLAEKVETYDVFERTLNCGFTLFQGYFFSKPQVLTRHDIPANKLNYLLILQAANRPVLDLAEVTDRIKKEPSLSYRLLRYLNSPAFFLISDIRSIPHALMLLGERGVRTWVSLVAIACMAEDKPEELIVLPLVRARFCELLAFAAGMNDSANDLFLLGLLSSVDAILDMTMENVLKEITVRQEIRDALLGKNNPLRRVFDAAVLYEMGSWDRLDQTAASLKISGDTISESFIQAVDWAREILSGRKADQGPQSANVKS